MKQTALFLAFVFALCTASSAAEKTASNLRTGALAADVAPQPVPRNTTRPLKSEKAASAHEPIPAAVQREIDAGLFPGAVVLVGRPGKVVQLAQECAEG